MEHVAVHTPELEQLDTLDYMPVVQGCTIEHILGHTLLVVGFGNRIAPLVADQSRLRCSRLLAQVLTVNANNVVGERNRVMNRCCNQEELTSTSCIRVVRPFET